MECGDCTLCCDLLYIKELNKPSNTLCTFCDKGCTIHNGKPKECASFKCAYYQMKVASEKMRPDNCGVIFEKLEDDLMFGSVNPKHKDFSFIQGQIQFFLKEGINVVLAKDGFPVVYHLDEVAPETILKRINTIQKRHGNCIV